MSFISLMLLIVITIGTLYLHDIALLTGMVAIFMLVFGYWMISVGYPVILFFSIPVLIFCAICLQKEIEAEKDLS